MKIAEIIQTIEDFAPLSYQETYDNSGLLIGDKTTECSGVLICLDALESVVDEAIAKGCNLVVAHHPIIFEGLKKITGKNYIERTVLKAIKHDIAIYAVHTNLDNVRLGVNKSIAQKLGLVNCEILEPKRDVLKKLSTFAPATSRDALLNALFAAGAGGIGNYSECSFTSEGVGTFMGNEFSNPVVGQRHSRSNEEEVKLELIFPAYLETNVLQALRQAHPYEEIAYEVISIDNTYQNVGSGLIGELEQPMSAIDFLSFLKTSMQTETIRHTSILGKPVQKVAVCGGAGSFLLDKAISKGADIFVSADFKYHQFFDADERIIIADIGHYESEQFTMELLLDLLKVTAQSVQVIITTQKTNPVHYL
jgi:dinuclear metal center YbgI/SA1388 family protein